MATVTILPSTEEDPILAVVRFTAELALYDAGPEVAEPHVNSLCQEAQDKMFSGRWLDLASLMLTSADLVFASVSVKDLECIFTVICNLVTRVGTPDEALEIAKLICSRIIQQPIEKASVLLKILFNLYNLLENPYSRFYVYMKALNLASSAKVTEFVIPTFKKMDNLLKDWELGKLDQRVLFFTIAGILKNNKSKDHFYFLSKYLATFSVEDVSAIGEAKEEAVQAIIEFVKAPDMFQCDLLDLPAISLLEKDDKYAPVYRLLHIFLRQRLDDYMEFHNTDSAVLDTYGLVHEDCITKMRLMTLADLGTRGNRHIAYSLIRDTLHVSDDAVEIWVVKAITAKLLDCKMDQMNETIIVSRCTERVFGLQQWQSLRSKLQVWRNNIASVVQAVQSNKASEDEGQSFQNLMVR